MASPAASHSTLSTKAAAVKKARDPIWLGGAAASMSACFTHPLDQTKYRMQVVSSRLSLLRAVQGFAMRDGVLSLWQGLSASILRQSTYSTARFAFYDIFSRHLASKSSNSSKPSMKATIASAGLAGGIAGLIGNPTKVVLVRMCADGAKAVSERFRYRNPLVGLIRIAREDGVQAYLRGLGPSVARSVLMNVSQIATYTEAKRRLLGANLGLKDHTWTHGLASLAAGTVATTVCAPADVLKSRFQNATAVTSGQRVSIVSYVLQTGKKEGPGFLIKGWTPAWLRMAPHTMLTFIFMENLKQTFVDR